MTALKTFLLLSVIFLTKICEGQSTILGDTSFIGRFAKYAGNKSAISEVFFMNASPCRSEVYIPVEQVDFPVGYKSISHYGGLNVVYGNRLRVPDSNISICCPTGLRSGGINMKNSEGQLPITITTDPPMGSVFSLDSIPNHWFEKVDFAKYKETYVTVGGQKSKSGVFGISVGPDTMCFETEVIRKVLIAANEGKEYKKQVGLLTERVALKDQIISQMNERDSLVKAGYENQMAILKQELDLRKDQMEGYERLLKKERRKRRAVAAAGLTATGVLTYLLITK